MKPQITVSPDPAAKSLEDLRNKGLTMVSGIPSANASRGDSRRWAIAHEFYPPLGWL